MHGPGEAATEALSLAGQQGFLAVVVEVVGATPEGRAGV